MSDRKLDVLFVHPGGGNKIYQTLRGQFSAIETPTWSLLLAESCRSKGFGVAILDVDADNLTDEQAVEKIKEADPRLVCFVVYGSEPNQGTVKMAGAVPLVGLLRMTYPKYYTCLVGTHAQAMPLDALNVFGIDIVLTNEGVYALHNLLAGDLYRDVHKVKGICFEMENGGACMTDGERIVPQDRMSEDLPGYAWDLIDVKKYRSHFWHGGYQHENRTPFAALYTSLGCPFKCNFCCINILNRTSNADVSAADSAVFRYWHPSTTLRQIDALVERGVKTIRFSDEMFFLRRQHYEPLLTMIRDKYGDSLNLWAYARVDTCKARDLALFRSAGIRWLCLGIESANQVIRREVTKGSYEDVDIRKVVKEVEEAGVEVIGNYIFGLPEDTHETMRETLDLSIELNTSMWNAYPAMALPGSPLYQQAKKEGKPLPESYEAFGFLSYECQPLGTKYLTPAEVLKFRDEAFHEYWTRPAFLDKIQGKFGPGARENIESMTKVKLKRKLLGD